MSEQQFKSVIVKAPNILTGHLGAFAADTIGFVQNIARYGDFVRVRYVHKWASFLFHPDLVQDFLIKKAKFFDKAGLLKQTAKGIVEDSIFFADGEQWKKQHKLMMPAFHAMRIGAYADTMVDFTSRTMAGWQIGSQVDVDMDKEMMALTMRIITKTMFDMELDFDVEEIGQHTEDLFVVLGERLEQPIVAPAWIPTPQNRRVAKVRAIMKSLMGRVTRKWREKGEDTGDLLSMLMLARYDDGSTMDDETLFRELITIFGAGHETTAHTLAYTFYALAKNPEIKAKAHAEIDQVLQGKLPTLETVNQLTYLNMVIKESMRLYPVAQATLREANQDLEICGVPVKKGETVSAPFWAVHHDPRWYPNPKTFDPERFSPENEKNIPKYAYIPFGGGPRVCIGNQFALLEVRLVLATILQRFDVSVADDYVMKPASAFTTKPASGLPMTVAVREKIAPPA